MRRVGRPGRGWVVRDCKEGASADLLICPRDPREDLGALRGNTVVLRGQVLSDG